MAELTMTHPTSAAPGPGANTAGHPPDARITACGEHGVTWQVRWWLADYARRSDIRHAVHEAVLHHLYQAGLSLAHKQAEPVMVPMPASPPPDCALSRPPSVASATMSRRLPSSRPIDQSDM